MDARLRSQPRVGEQTEPPSVQKKSTLYLVGPEEPKTDEMETMRLFIPRDADAD